MADLEGGRMIITEEQVTVALDKLLRLTEEYSTHYCQGTTLGDQKPLEHTGSYFSFPSEDTYDIHICAACLARLINEEMVDGWTWGAMGMKRDPNAPEHALDPEIARAVRVLQEGHVYTCGSCIGGGEHPYPVPTVQFHGSQAEGFRALAIALEHGLRPTDLRRTWSVVDGEPTGPIWELTFWPNKELGIETDEWIYAHPEMEVAI